VEWDFSKTFQREGGLFSFFAKVAIHRRGQTRPPAGTDPAQKTQVFKNCLISIF
jgi:hypothetical protein